MMKFDQISTLKFARNVVDFCWVFVNLISTLIFGRNFVGHFQIIFRPKLDQKSTSKFCQKIFQIFFDRSSTRFWRQFQWVMKSCSWIWWEKNCSLRYVRNWMCVGWIGTMRARLSGNETRHHSRQFISLIFILSNILANLLRFLIQGRHFLENLEKSRNIDGLNTSAISLKVLTSIAEFHTECDF